MIKAWFVCSKDDETYLTHDDDDVPYEGSADTIIEEGFFVTKEELKEIWDTARQRNIITHFPSDVPLDLNGLAQVIQHEQTFEDYIKDKHD